jgi:glycosyltransferase involved in cell wall biosynthesis
MIRILYIIDELGPGGAERRLIQLLGRLDEERFEAKVILLTDIIHYPEVSELKAEIITLRRRIRFDPTIYRRLHGICRKWRPDVIHAWGSLPAVYAGPVARMLRIRFINAMIAGAPRRLNLQQRFRALFSFPFSDIIQSNSHAGLRAYGVSGGKGNVIHNGFDFDRIRQLRDTGSIREELGVRTEYVVGMVAGFHPLKDYESLVKAAEEVLGLREDVTFVCVGGGTELEKTRRMAGFTDRIVFPGERSDVESIVQIFDIGILSTFGEGISNSIMEYMALGKPVIASEGGGTVELVLDGETGFIIPQRSPDVLAEKILLLLNDGEMRAAMGRRGRERIEKEFHIDRMVADHMSLYEEMVSGRR